VNNRRWALAGLAVAASFALATAGCNTAPDDTAGGGSGSGTPSTSVTTPKDALLASAKDLKTTPFKAQGTLSGGVAVESSVDPVAKAGVHKMSLSIPQAGMTMTAEQITIGNDVYAKIATKNFPDARVQSLPKGWMKVDLAKIKKPSDYTLDDPDPANLEAYVFPALSTVDRAGDRGFTGALDLAKAKDSGIVDEDVVTALKEKAAAVPFEATVDDKGRILTFKILVPAAGTNPAEAWQVTYSNYGTPVKVTKPASSVPAPDVAYAALFNA
jgi:hypothetical protein